MLGAHLCGRLLPVPPKKKAWPLISQAPVASLASIQSGVSVKRSPFFLARFLAPSQRQRALPFIVSRYFRLCSRLSFVIPLPSHHKRDKREP